MRFMPFVIALLFVTSGEAQRLRKNVIPELIEGTWVRDASWNPYSFRFERKEEVVKNNRAFIFRRDGKVTIYGEFGCQTPPHFQFREADWWVSGKNEISIDRLYPGEKVERLRIILLKDDEFRFVYK